MNPLGCMNPSERSEREGEEDRLSVTEARSSLSDVLNRVKYRHERIVLTRHGKPVAAFVPEEDLQILAEAIKRSQ